jgi:hypothetical protein
MNMKHMEYLKQVALDDVTILEIKEGTYRGSWKKRGGVGAFMMLARKWDRLENMVEVFSYNVFTAINEDDTPGADGTTLAEIQDLRRYLLLVEAEYRARLSQKQSAEDGGHHAQQDDDDTGLDGIERGKLIGQPAYEILKNAPNVPCPHGYADADDCPDCRH